MITAANYTKSSLGFSFVVVCLFVVVGGGGGGGGGGVCGCVSVSMCARAVRARPHSHDVIKSTKVTEFLLLSLSARIHSSNQ